MKRTKGRETGRTRWVAGVLTVLGGAALALTGGTALAKKPVKPPPASDLPGGTIFLSSAAAEHEYLPNAVGATLWSVAPDGSGLIERAAPAGCISNEVHGGDYWSLFFAEVGGLDPNGLPRLGLLAARVSDGRTVSLIDDTAVHFDASRRNAWAPGDGGILFSALLWDAEGVSIQASGIFRVDVTWSSTGEPALAGPPSHLVSTQPWVMQGRTHSGAGSFDLATNGDYFAFVTQSLTHFALHIADGSYDVLATLTGLQDHPQYSPDSSALTITWDMNADQAGDIVITDPDGSSPALLVAGRLERNKVYVTTAARAWAPGGTHLAFTSALAARRDLNRRSHTVEVVDVETGDVTVVIEEEMSVLAWRP